MCVLAAGRRSRAVPHRLVVDVREFMSGLPAVLHTQGFKLTPITLEVRVGVHGRVGGWVGQRHAGVVGVWVGEAGGGAYSCM
jgi:hypothetical protein